MIQKKLLTFLILSITLPLSAQKRFDLFYVGGNINFMKKDSLERSKNYEGSIVANLTVPILFKDSSKWITLIDYQSYSINNNFLPTDSTPVQRFDLHAFFLRTGYVHRFNASQSLQVLAFPRLMTDFNASFSKSLQIGGIVMYEKIKNKRMTWRIGALYNTEFFGPSLIPLFYLDCNIGKKLKFTGLLPINGKLYKQPSDRFSYGLHFIGLTTTYRIYEPGYENYYVERKSIDLSLFANKQVWKNVFLEARAGYSVSKDYGLFAEDQKIDLALPLYYFGDNRTRSNGEYFTTPFVHLRLLYSIPVK